MTQAYDSSSACSQHVYPTAAMVGDYLRSGAGLVPAVALVATVPLGAVATTVIGGFAVVFGVFGIRTLLRHGTRLEVSGSEIRAIGPRPRVIPWAELDRLKLSYFSTHRDRSSGWMQLELGAGRARLRLDSRITGFAELTEQAAAAAFAHGVALNAATVANLQQLDVTVPRAVVEAAR